MNRIGGDLLLPDLDVFEKQFLERMMAQRQLETKLASLNQYVEYLNDNPDEQINLRFLLHVSYSEFFRNQLTFAVLARLILPEIIHRYKASPQREIRIWSAASSAGQEAYSIAMLLEDLSLSNSSPLNYRIIASDVNEKVINAGKQGVFDAKSMANIPHKFILRWFTQENGYYVVNPELREKINFIEYDLLSKTEYCPPECIYGDFDLVICSNILFYYQPETRKSIFNKITRCLSPDGYLVTGEAERDSIPHRLFSEVYPPSAIYIQKNIHGKS